MRKRILLLLVLTVQISLFNYIFAQAEGPKNYLKGKFYSSVKDHFLIATEKMRDNRFQETVIAMLENDEDGAWGLVVNKPIGVLPLALLIDPSLNTSEERETWVVGDSSAMISRMRRSWLSFLKENKRHTQIDSTPADCNVLTASRTSPSSSGMITSPR